MKAQQMLNTDPLQLTKNHYKIRGRSDFDWHVYDKVRFEVSLNSEQHEGAKVEAIAEWLHRHFGHVVVLVGDVLHRYNYILDKSCADMEEAFARSIKQGQEWSARNGHYFLDATPIISWREFLEDPNFFDALQKSRYLFNNNEMFHKNLSDAIQEKWDRMKKRNEDLIEWEEFQKISLNYLLEETAGLSIAYKRFPGVSAYPGEYNDMWSMFAKDNIEGAPEGLDNAQCIRICINRRKSKSEEND